MEQNGMGKKLLSLMLMWTLVIGLMPGMSVTVPVKAEEPVSIPEDNPEGAEKGTNTPAPDTLTEGEENQTHPETMKNEDEDDKKQDPVLSVEPTTDQDAEPVKNTEPVVEQGSEENDKTKQEETNPAQPEQTEESVTVEYPAFESYQYVDGVKVTVTAEEGTFPEGTTLSVEKVEVKKVEEAVEEERREDVKVATSYTFDIKLLDKAGNEIQPADGKTVNVSFKLAEVADQNLSTDVYHFSEEGNDYTAELLEVSEKGTEATVETTGFSYYTVEFTYNNLQYVLNGDESIPLSTILNTVGLTGEVTAAEVSNDSLFTVSNNNGQLVVTALQAFTSTEWMKVTINDVVYEIVVTDAISYNLWVGGVQVTSANANNILGNNTASYDAESNTLTLNGVAINSGYEYATSKYAGIYYTGSSPLNIALTGQNKIKGDIDFDIGICSTDPSAVMTISGTGTLDVYGSELGISGISDVIIDGATVVATASETIGMGGSGIYSNEGNITINGGMVKASGYNGIYSPDGDVSISDCKVEATSTTGDGIYVHSGEIAISDAEVTASCYEDAIYSNGNIEISNSTVTAESTAAELPEHGYGIGIYSRAGKITISNSTVTAESAAYELDQDAYSVGIYAESGDIEIEDDSNVTAYGYTAGILSGKDLMITSGVITAQGDGYGIRTQGDITISSGTVLAITYGIGDRTCGIDASGNLTITGGDITAEGGASSPGASVRSYGIAAKNATITGGTITAIARGIFDEPVNVAFYSTGDIAIAKTVTTFVAEGTSGAFNAEAKVKNAIVGTGWTDTDKEGIATSTGGQALNNYKKVMFPDGEDYLLWVGGKRVTSVNASDILGDNTASYDAKSDTLTLNGVTITDISAAYQGDCGICYRGSEPLYIVLSGENRIENADFESAFHSYSDAPVHISGTGSLTASASSSGFGLYSSGPLTIEGGVTVKSSGGRAIYSNSDITIEDSTVTATGNRDGGIWTTAGLTIIDSKINVSATGNSQKNFGIYASDPVTIKDGSIVTAVASGRDSAGIISWNYSISIEDSTVVVKASGENSAGICARNNRNITISSGIVSASGSDKAFNGNVKNSITGTGWTETGSKIIGINTAGQSLTYKKVQFPEAAIKPIEGNGFVWHKGSSDSSTIRFSSETDSDLAGVDSLTGVSVDGKDLTEGTHYETAPGSVYVTFTKSYLETLGVGAHRVVATFSTYSGDVNATFTVAAKSSGGGTTPKKDNVVTCQMAGFPANYAWNEAAKACQPGYIDAGGNFHSYNNAKHSSVPNTSDNGNLTMYVIAMFLMTFVAYITAKKLTEDSRA